MPDYSISSSQLAKQLLMQRGTAGNDFEAILEGILRALRLSFHDPRMREMAVERLNTGDDLMKEGPSTRPFSGVYLEHSVSVSRVGELRERDWPHTKLQLENTHCSEHNECQHHWKEFELTSGIPLHYGQNQVGRVSPLAKRSDILVFNVFTRDNGNVGVYGRCHKIGLVLRARSSAPSGAKKNEVPTLTQNDSAASVATRDKFDVVGFAVVFGMREPTTAFPPLDFELRLEIDDAMLLMTYAISLEHAPTYDDEGNLLTCLLATRVSSGIGSSYAMPHPSYDANLRRHRWKLPENPEAAILEDLTLT